MATKICGVPIENNSRLRLSELRPLLEFAIGAVGQEAQNTRMTIVDHCVAWPAGLAEMYGEEENALYPSHVLICLGSMLPDRYPSTQRYLPELPEVAVESWEEEFLLVVTHELRHIKQFWTDFDCENTHGMEIDAEAFAIKTLLLWRQQKTTRKAA
jgi:hypothetical protein